MIKAVIFDLDGTILDTIEDLADAMNQTMVHFGYPPCDDLKIHMSYIGTGARNYVKGSMPKEAAEDEAQVDACLNQYRVFYRADACVKTKPYPGIDAVLDYLKKAGISINVLSNKPDEPTRALVSKCFAQHSFDFVYGERPNVPRKPDPAAPLAIAEALGVLPSEVAFVGDSQVDIKTGLGAGMIPIGVLWGFRSRAQLLESGATHLAETPAQLITLFKQLNI